MPDSVRLTETTFAFPRPVTSSVPVETMRSLPQRAVAPTVPAWAKAYHNCGTFGATDDDCDPPKHGALYAFCDTEWAEVCDQKALMLKDV